MTQPNENKHTPPDLPDEKSDEPSFLFDYRIPLEPLSPSESDSDSDVSDEDSDSTHDDNDSDYVEDSTPDDNDSDYVEESSPSTTDESVSDDPEWLLFDTEFDRRSNECLKTRHLRMYSALENIFASTLQQLEDLNNIDANSRLRYHIMDIDAVLCDVQVAVRCLSED